MGDREVREALADLEGYVFDEVPWTIPGPLAQSRVAVVTTAGLRPARSDRADLADGVTEPGADWNPGDQSFTVLPADTRDLTLAPLTPNFH
nr:hypothetical protein [Actinomycetota bacterium]